MSNLGMLVILIPALPLLSAILTAILGPRLLRHQSHWLTIGAIIGSCICSLLLARGVSIVAVSGEGYGLVQPLWTWADVPGAMANSVNPGTYGTQGTPFRIDVALRADSLTATMLCMVTFVASLVAIYASGYMHGDRSYWRFFTYVSVFVFSMTMLVLVSNFLLLFVFWEAVGACSYLLIGFWYEKEEAAAAGKKAFLVNRVGDFGFALALFLIWITYGTLNFHDVPGIPGVIGQARLSGEVGFVFGPVATAICLLLLLGACGKSAQFPLHVWLPDAMEGPTPVSALIHAATMVTAGVYMIARCTPLFLVSPDAQLTVACVGGITALMAGIIAMTQNDLKRVLAYSTISQLGYMFLALGTGTLAGITAGMFHLFTHAFFKALLFLGAGSVMHAMGNVIDMRRFGGLRHVMPGTHLTFAIGCLALAGIPPLAGFWSKDAILHSVESRIHQLQTAELAMASLDGAAPESDDAASVGANANAVTPGVEVHAAALSTAYREYSPARLAAHRRVFEWLMFAGVLTAFLTAFYTARAFFMTFYGPELIPEEAHGHAHESPQVMLVPLIVLAVCAVFVGWVGNGAASTFEEGGQLHLAEHGEHHELPRFAEFLTRTPSLAFAEARATEVPHIVEMSSRVAVISMTVAFLGIGLAAFLYLGHQREVDVLTWLMDFRWLGGLAEMGWVRWLGELGPVASIHRAASAAGLGAVTTVIGYILLMVLTVLMLPLLIGYYLSPFKLSQHKFYVDEIYNAAIVAPMRGLAWLSYAVDRLLVDGLVNLAGNIPVWTGGLMRTLQTGMVPFYGLAMVLGTLTLLVARMLWGAQ